MGKKTLLALLIFLAVLLLPAASLADKTLPGGDPGIPILAYHRFGPRVADGMTVTTPVFESHLTYLRDRGFRVLPLREIVERCLGNGGCGNFRAVALTADDGHISIYTEALPLLKKYRVPMTLFLYPSAISNASYAMTWEQLRELKATGLFDFQSHTYWHPNFKKERARLKPAEYEKTVETQLRKSREVLERKMELKVSMLAWPFGIYDPLLEAKASQAGYTAAFSIDRHRALPSERKMSLPRYLMTNADRGKAFESIVGGNNGMRN